MSDGTSRLLKCLRCLGTGWASPPRPDRRLCPACDGSGEVDENNTWAGYCRSLDYSKGVLPR
jgi:DnaJ-class molecular chaperone